MVYCGLVKLHHPDTGGDPEQFHQIQRAYDQTVAS
jgi:curved DNA-binding protein CbpA